MMDKHTYTYIGTPRRKKPWWESIPIYIILICFLLVTGINLARIDHVCRTQKDLISDLSYMHECIDDQSSHLEAIDEWMTDIERDTIERVVAAESRGEPLEGMVAVAQVIKDRGDLWGMDYYDVVTSPNQFAEPYSGEISDDVKQAVSLVFDHGARAFEELTTYFHSGQAPYWTAGKIARGEIGGHRFWY